MSEPVTSPAYVALLAHLRETYLFSTAASVLSWDQETMMPPRGAQFRADQLAALSALAHERHVAPQVGDWIAECEADAALLANATAAANVREMRREYDRLVRLPGSLVRELAQTTALALQAWREARERSEFAHFQPWLEKVFVLSRAQGECLAQEPGAGVYDALMDAYEPGARTVDLEAVFADLRAQLVPLIAEVGAASPPRAFEQAVPIPIDQQVAFNRMVAARLGFDFRAGRLDISTHPFCEGIGPGDTRMTTRYQEDNFADALSSMMHEVGHGLYEQGLPKAEHVGEPVSQAASLGIHESQSRLWENFVGRSRAFWDWALPEAQKAIGAALATATPEAMYAMVNRVRPNLIRVDSDEATYNLHIMLRFDLERALLSGELPIADLPGVWNERVLQDLGLTVPDDRRGCLQDIHWSMGAIGYFPTYTLGTLFAAQLWRALTAAVPEADERIAAGDFAPVLEWLRANIHRHGRRHSAAELCVRATGEPLSAAPFVEYLKSKVRSLYGV